MLHNRPVLSAQLKTPAARRNIPIPACLVSCLREAKEKSDSDFVIADSNGEPLAESQFVRMWNYITVRSTKERTYYKNGQKIKHTIKPIQDTNQAVSNTIQTKKKFFCLNFNRYQEEDLKSPEECGIIISQNTK